MKHYLYPEHSWIQKSIGLTRLETLRLEKMGEELEEKLREFKLERSRENPLHYELPLEGITYRISAKNLYDIPGAFKHIFENHPMAERGQEVLLVCNDEHSYLMD